MVNLIHIHSQVFKAITIVLLVAIISACSVKPLREKYPDFFYLFGINGIAGAVPGVNIGIAGLKKRYPFLIELKGVLFDYYITVDAVFDGVKKAHSEGRLIRPLVIIGISLGCSTGLSAAHSLADSDINVDLLVCADMGWKPCVPDNVRRAINLRPPLGARIGSALKLCDGNDRTKVSEHLVHAIPVPTIGHILTLSDPGTIEIISAAIERARQEYKSPTTHNAT